MIKFSTYTPTYSKDLGKVNEVSLSWEDIKSLLTTHTFSETKGGNSYFVGGVFSDTHRARDSFKCRTMLTFDIDGKESPMSFSEIEDKLSKLNVAFAAYSTYSSTDANPRVRIVLPLDEPVSSWDDFRNFSKQMADTIGLRGVDNASHTASQFMYLPSCPVGSTPWVMSNDGPYLKVAIKPTTSSKPKSVLFAKGGKKTVEKNKLSDKLIALYLSAIDVSDLEYEGWLKVGAALHFELDGSPKGLNYWKEWSAKDFENYDEDEISYKWDTFKSDMESPVTFRTVAAYARENFGALDFERDMILLEEDNNNPPITSAELQTLVTEASAINTIPALEAFYSKIQGMSVTRLGAEDREMVAGAIKSAKLPCGKISINTIRNKLESTYIPEYARDGKTLPPSYALQEKQFIAEILHKDNVEKTLGGKNRYVFSEQEGVFLKMNEDGSTANITLQAFNLVYSGLAEDKLTAAQVVIRDGIVPIVHNAIFDPTKGSMFEFKGDKYVNTYTRSGIQPSCEHPQYDAIVARFEKHIDNTLNPEEAKIFLDWISYVYQNQGRKIMWAAVLQGTQGSGKTLISKLMKRLMGRHVRELNNHDLESNFNDWADGGLLQIVEEVRVEGHNKYRVLNDLKPYITNDAISLNAKGRAKRDVPVYFNFLMFTNHKNALPVGEDDRRYGIFFSKWQSTQDMLRDLGGFEGMADYFDTLHSDIEDDDKVACIAHFLQNRELSEDFNPYGHAPITAAKKAMAVMSKSHGHDIVKDAIADHTSPIMCDDLVDVTLLGQLLDDNRDAPRKGALTNILLDLGYTKPVSYENVKIKGGKVRRIWIKEGNNEMEARKTLQEYYKDGKELADALSVFED